MRIFKCLNRYTSVGFGLGPASPFQTSGSPPRALYPDSIPSTRSKERGVGRGGAGRGGVVEGGRQGREWDGGLEVGGGRVEGWKEGDEMGMAYLCHSFPDIDDSDSASVFSQVTHELESDVHAAANAKSCKTLLHGHNYWHLLQRRGHTKMKTATNG